MQSLESARNSKKAQLQQTRNLGNNITVPEMHRRLDIAREDRMSSEIGSEIMRCKLKLARYSALPTTAARTHRPPIGSIVSRI